MDDPIAAPRLLIIDPSTCSPEDEGVEEWRRAWSGRSVLLRPALGPEFGPGPGTGHDFDAVVLMGSASSVHDELPWAGELSAWLAPLITGPTVRPLFGICYGHQLVAKIAGGVVGPAEKGGKKRVGVEECRLLASTLLPGRHALRCVVSHHDAVTRPPEHFRVVAGRPGLPFDALEHEERPIFTFQGHPEARASFLEERGLSGSEVDEDLIEGCDSLLRAFCDFALARRASVRRE